MTFPYFGSKRSTAKLYPRPKYSIVIEPFAGAAAYTMHYRPPIALLIDADPRVIGLWDRVARISDDTPTPTPPEIGSRTSDLLYMCMTYSEHASTSKYMSVSKRMVRDWSSVHRRLREAAPYIRSSCAYKKGTYRSAPDIEATWFIDPPYQHANRRGYAKGASQIDFSDLAAWVMSRRGQVIVCEQSGADWLPFKHLVDVSTHRGAKSIEVIYTRETQ